MRSKLIIVVIMIFILVTGCGKKEKENNVISDSLKFKEEYESLNGKTREKDGKTIRTISIDEDNPFIYSDAKEVLEMIENKKTFIVYFGFSDCPWCRSVIPTLIEVAKDQNVDKIYYVDVKNIRDTLSINENGKVETAISGNDDYYNLLTVFDNVLDNYVLKDENGNKIETGEKRIFAPNIISVVNGVPNEKTDGISSKQIDGYQELTKAMKKESFNKIKCVLKCVSNNKNICTKETSC